MRRRGADQREDLRERLRRLGMVRGVRSLPPSRKRPVSLERVVQGRFHETPHGRCLVVEETLPLHHRHGDLPLGAFFDLDPDLLSRLGGEPRPIDIDPGRVLFLDTETTSLSGGTGTMAFLVGLGFFEEDRFRTVQVFLRDPGDEPAMIAFLADLLPRFNVLITFNGRGFDVPILETRFILARRPFPLAAALHVDLLPPSRRLWRFRLPSCSLGVLEREVLGVERDQADVPSGVIPQIYVDYLRTGDAREIPRILYHNRIDVLSMVTLAARLGHSLTTREGLEGPDLYALARWGQGTETESLLRRALAQGLPLPLRLRALRDLALLLKRAGRRGEAIEWWQQLALEDPLGILAPVELAKTFEWHIHRPDLALRWTEEALSRVGRWPAGPRRDRAVEALQRRRARLQRKRAPAPPTTGAPPEERFDA
ncbi:MAG TPA: hypothetical protein ENK08_09050 [Chloroflexi bacterium]|nr:hypothetical protein [Chloroflexota bacterium]